MGSFLPSFDGKEIAAGYHVAYHAHKHIEKAGIF